MESSIQSIAELIALQQGKESTLTPNECQFIQQCCDFLKRVGGKNLKVHFKDTPNRFIIFFANAPTLDLSQFDQLQLKSPKITNVVFNVNTRRLTIFVNRFDAPPDPRAPKKICMNLPPSSEIKLATKVDYANIHTADVGVLNRLIYLIEHMDKNMTAFDVKISNETNTYKVDFSKIPDTRFEYVLFVKKQLDNYITDIKFDFFNNMLVFILNKNATDDCVHVAKKRRYFF